MREKKGKGKNAELFDRCIVDQFYANKSNHVRIRLKLQTVTQVVKL